MNHGRRASCGRSLLLDAAVQAHLVAATSASPHGLTCEFGCPTRHKASGQPTKPATEVSDAGISAALAIPTACLNPDHADPLSRSGVSIVLAA